MTSRRSDRPGAEQRLGQLAVGIAAGALLGLLTSIAPVISIIAIGALVIATWIGLAVRRRRMASLAGMVLGSGLFLLWGAYTTIQACSLTSNFCGDANVVPLIAFSVAGVSTGVFASIVSLRRP
ncbi:MAG: hypothetical protein H0U52_01205 [Chloroflexi bacterium]|nr:hypothetical protein [Chloroflexota bacterium]